MLYKPNEYVYSILILQSNAPQKNILTFCVFFNILCKWKTTSTQWTLQNHFTLTYQQHTTELIPYPFRQIIYL